MTAGNPSSDQTGVIVIATYNEIANLPRLVDELFDRLSEFDILVIDDDSPDGTGDWAQGQTANDSRFHLIRRQGKLGLGSATVAGFEWALDRGYELIATMDSDFSHAPEDFVRMVERIQAQPSVDVVLGSRYTPGGGIEGWPLFRRWTSKITNWFARLTLGLKTKDNTGAFRIYRRMALDSIGVSELHTGYAYLPELIWRLQKAGQKIVEVPILFRDRIEGVSKTSLRIGLSVYWHLLTLRIRK